MLVSAALTRAATGDNVLKTADAAFKEAPDITADTTMTLIDSAGKEKVRELKTWIRNFPGEDKDSWRLMKFVSPSDVRNVGFLVLEEDVMYLYMPEFKKNRRIASHNKKDSFVGSDFFYDDLSTTDYASHYSADIALEDDKTWTLELTRKSGSDKPYPSMQVIISKASNMMEHVMFRDSSGEPWKVLDNTIVKVNGYWVSGKMVMEDLKKNHKTVMEMNNIKVDSGLEDNLFSERLLKRPVK